MHYKVYSKREFQRILKNNGYILSRYSGSHEIWIKNRKDLTDSIILPQSVNPMIIRRTIKEKGLKE